MELQAVNQLLTWHTCRVQYKVSKWSSDKALLSSTPTVHIRDVYSLLDCYCEGASFQQGLGLLVAGPSCGDACPADSS